MTRDSKPRRTAATVVGTVDSIGPMTTRGTFTFREVLIVEGGRYPNPLVVQFSGDALGDASTLAPGDMVTIACNLRGREWTKPATGEVKHFMSLSAWKIEEHDKSARHTASAVTGGQAAEDDLPF